MNRFLFAAAAAAVVMVMYARRRRKRSLHSTTTSSLSFAPMASEMPPDTVAALTRHRWLALRHKCVCRGIEPAKLEKCFDDIRATFSPQQVDYSNTAYGKNHWTLSCFMEYSNGVAAGNIDLAAGAPLLDVCRGLLDECDSVFLPWWETLHPKPRNATRTLHRMQSFVTRYRPMPSETHLPRHIDGANVDGSLILGLPTYSSFGASGGLTVWDGEDDAEQFVYPVAAGDVCLLDSRVWHQSNPISDGERWVIVIFYEVRTTKVPKAAADRPPTTAHAQPNGASADAEAGSRGKAVRDLLARRIKDAAKRREMSEAALAPKATQDRRAAAASWHA